MHGLKREFRSLGPQGVPRLISTMPSPNSPATTEAPPAGHLSLPLAVPFFLSGAAALISELCWLRAMTVHLGGSAAALNIVLMTFMAGLSLGAHLARGLARRGRPLALYAIIEALLCIYVFFSAHLILLTGSAFADLLPLLGHETAVAQLARLVVAAIVLLVPTIMMGATTPLLIAATVGRWQEAASATGWLYGVNTLGAAVGALLGGCFLIVSVGVTQSLQTAAALNGLAAVLAAVVAWAHGEKIRGGGEVAALSAPGARNGRAELRLALLAAMTGFLGMSLQVTLIRLLVFLIGSTYYSHAIAISAFLFGLVAGSFAIMFVGRRVVLDEAALRVGLVAFGLSIAAAGLLSEKLPFLAEQILIRDGIFGLGPLGIKLFAAFSLVALPATCSGALLPIIVQVWARRCGDTRRATSLAFAANTFGGVLGVGLTGFWLIEAVGVRGALFGAAAAAVLVAAVAARGESASRMRLWLTAAAASLVVLAVSKHERPLVLDSLTYRDLGRPPLLFYREDAAVSVSVVETVDGSRTLLINGLTAATIDRQDRGRGATAAVAMASHPKAKQVPVAGLGTGAEAGVAGLYDGVQVRVVEIAQAVIDAFPFFDPMTFDGSRNSAIRVQRGDARHYLEATQDRFDLILPDVYISELTGTAYLYNVEFFALCARRLRPGGRLVMQLDAGDPVTDPNHPPIDAIIAAGFVQSFPHLALVHLPEVGKSYFIGANEPIDLPESAGGAAQRREVQELLRATGLEREGGLRAYLRADGPALRRVLAGIPASTDDHPIVDYVQALGTRERALIW